MSKKLVGSLVVAPAAPSPQELPPAVRLAALLDKAAAGADSNTTASILRTKLGSYVQPASCEGFVAKTMLKQGGLFVLNGHTLTGKLAQMVVKDAVKDFVPLWARRIASIAVIAWDSGFDKMVKGMIADHGLPVDEDVNWDARLNHIFRAAGLKNEDLIRDAVMEAILTMLQRKSLERFDPTKGEARDGVEVPLDKRVTAYVTDLFRWQATGRSEAGQQLRKQQYDAGFTIDEPLGDDQGATLGDLTIGDYVDQEAEAHSESVIRSLDQFMSAFEAYLQKARGGNLSKTCIQLMRIIISAHDAAEVKARWPIETGTSYSNMRRVLAILSEELVNFSQSSTAPNIHLTELINRLRQRVQEQAASSPTTPEPSKLEPTEDTEQVGTKAKEMQQTPKAGSATPIAICASATDFMTKLAAYVSMMTKEAAPKVVEQSILYLRLGGNRANPRFMDISFYSPKLRTTPGAGSYKIEVGDWGQDKSLPERRIRQAVGTFVIPMMRGDVLDEDHDLLEKVIRRLRSIVWENAVEYFQIPFDQKADWRNVVKMDIARLMDTKVTIQDPEQGTIEVAASLTEGAHGRKAARKVAGDFSGKDAEEQAFRIAGGYPAEDDSPEGFHVVGSKRQIAVNAACDACEAPGAAWEPVQPKPVWNEEKQQWEPGDKTPGGLLGGQPARYGSKRAKAAAFMSTQELERLGKEAAGGLMDGPYWDEQKRQRAERATSWNIQPGGFINREDWYGDVWAEVIDAFEGRTGNGPYVSYYRYEKDGSPNRQHGGKDSTFGSYLKAYSPTLPANARIVAKKDGLYVDGRKVVPPAKQARSLGGELNLTPAEQTDFAPDPDHMTTSSLKEATVSAKFAALKRIAAENPEAIAEAIDGLKSQLSEQLNNLTILQENLGIVAPVEGAEVKEGAPMEVQEVEGEEKFAGLKHLAAEEPAQLEEAFGEFYLAMDKVMAQTEALADNLDITLPDAAPVDVEEEAAEEGETVPEEVAEGADGDDGLHGEQPVGEEEPVAAE